MISTANGQFTEFKTAYHTGKLPGAHYQNPPVELPNDYDAVRRAFDRLAPPAAREAEGAVR